MLYTIAVVLSYCGSSGSVTSYTMGGVIHVLRDCHHHDPVNLISGDARYDGLPTQGTEFRQRCPPV